MANFIEFPVFDGVSGDLRQWISWLEDFFVRERFTEDEKMNLAQSLLEGEANAWFYSSRKRFAFQSWEHLVVELLLWSFGHFGDGGVFSDLELFLLWNKYDRILRKRRKRMTTTSIPEKNLNLTASGETTDSTLATKSIQEAISESVLDGDASIEKDESYEATMVKVEDDTTMFQVSDSLEEESIHQNQVPVVSVEPSLSFSNESLVVSEARPSDIVSNNRVQSQSGFECLKNMNNAHHVFDELSRRRRQCQQRKKLSLSPKSRMFKFKNRTLLRNWSQMDLHQVIDISNVTNSYPCFSADFGLVRKKRTFQCLRLRNLRLHKQAHMSRFLYPMRMLHDPGGMKQLLHGDMQSMFVCVREFASLLEVIWVWAECMMHTTTVISAKLHSLFSCEVDTAENMSSGLSPTSQVWEPGGVLANHVLVDWFMAFTGYDRIVAGIRCLEIGVCSGIKQPIASRRASRVWERGGLDISAELTDWLKKCYKGFEFSRWVRQLHKIDLQWVRRKDLEDLCVGHGFLVFPWNLMLLEFFLFFHLEDKVCLSGASNRWWGWLVFDRGKDVQTDTWTVKDVQREMFLLEKAKDAHVHSLISSMLPLYVYQMVVSDIQDNDKEMVADPVTQAARNLVTNAARFGFITVLSQTHAVHLDVHLEFSETSASTSLYGYCLPSTRSWPYHRKILIREIVGYGADVVCLQDVQIGHFEDFLAPELKKHGYECCYMKRNKKTYEVDYNKSAQALIDASNSKPFASERLIKDNIVLIAVLEAKFGDPSGKLICVANTRFDVQTDLKDVMLWQVHTLSNGLEVKSSSIWHRWRRKPLFLLHFWKKNCWYQRLFLLSGLMMTGHREFLVQWQHRDSETSWMLSQDFASLYSALKLEDKLVFRGESIDTIQGLVMTWLSLQVKGKTPIVREALPLSFRLRIKGGSRVHCCFSCELWREILTSDALGRSMLISGDLC